MTDAAAADEAATGKKTKLPLILGLGLALVGGGGGFFAVYSGLLFGGDANPSASSAMAKTEAEYAFVAIDPMIVSVGPPRAGRHLRFQAQLEVTPGAEDVVSAQMPRIVDVLNGYLRAVDATNLDNPAALIRLRSQMLRRVQIVAGDGLVRDLLVIEFVLT